MKYSNYIGVIAAITLVCFCFAPWVYIEAIKTTITGLETTHTNFGKPGLVHITLAFFSIILFLIARVWAKRTNLFVVALNFAWSIRNFFLITQCELGECPEKKLGIYAIVLVSAVILLMGLLPKITLRD